MITTQRFVLRQLTVEDASETYLSWLHASTARFITFSVIKLSIEDLRQYLREQIQREDTFFFGIFTRDKGAHIGNIKYCLIDVSEHQFDMGILIGDANWHGRGVAVEVISATMAWLGRERRARSFLLGVRHENKPALRAYQKLGFKEVSRDSHGLKMVYLNKHQC